jgi:glutathione S-transferase
MKIAGTSLKPLELWRSDVRAEETLDFAQALAATAVRGGAGGMVGRLGPRPREMLILYEREWCPYSRLVREALAELDLDALIKPCPEGEQVHTAEVRTHTGETQIPFLIDPAAGVKLVESKLIVDYLFERYGDLRGPRPLRARYLSLPTSKLATHLRGGEPAYVAPTSKPEQPLVLWGYEASPYTRFVRERLGLLGLYHASMTLARKSPRRAAFQEQFGRMQFPRLFDPNTQASLFESGEILSYLERTYAPRPLPAASRAVAQERSLSRS